MQFSIFVATHSVTVLAELKIALSNTESAHTHIHTPSCTSSSSLSPFSASSSSSSSGLSAGSSSSSSRRSSAEKETAFFPGLAFVLRGDGSGTSSSASETGIPRAFHIWFGILLGHIRVREEAFLNIKTKLCIKYSLPSTGTSSSSSSSSP